MMDMAELRRRYREPHRKYHTHIHIQECMLWLGRAEALASISEAPRELGALREAIWVHDAIYDPQASDNEARSAELASSEEAKRLVRWTDHSRTDQPKADDADARLLIDIDLAILGAHPYRYREYTEQVRVEFKHLATDVWGQGRTAFLNAVLKRPRIYLTDFFGERLEVMARDNLAWELKNLELLAEHIREVQNG